MVAGVDCERLEIRDLVIKILNEERRALDVNTLIARIEEYRGLGQNKQIHTDDLILTNNWGEYYLAEYEVLEGK